MLNIFQMLGLFIGVGGKGKRKEEIFSASFLNMLLKTQYSYIQFLQNREREKKIYDNNNSSSLGPTRLNSVTYTLSMCYLSQTKDLTQKGKPQKNFVARPRENIKNIHSAKALIPPPLRALWPHFFVKLFLELFS